MKFDWDDEKAKRNLAKHHVTFAEAQSVFDDPFARIASDPDHSLSENRELIFGHSAAGRILLVSFVQRENTIRIISARKANQKERRSYEESR
jgi:uncharacterized protein